MNSILLFRLLFVRYNLSPKDLREYDCHVENSSRVQSESTRSMDIILQEAEKAVAKEKLSRNHTVVTLQCSDMHSPIQVNLLYSEMYSILTDKTNIKLTLQSLKVVTAQDENVSAAHSCLLLTAHKKLRTEFNLTGKVFLAGISNCTINANLSEPEIFAEQLHSTAARQQNSSTGTGEDMLLRLRQTQSIYIKVSIVCLLLPGAVAFVVFVIFEVPFPREAAYQASWSKVSKLTAIREMYF